MPWCGSSTKGTDNPKFESNPMYAELDVHTQGRDVYLARRSIAVGRGHLVHHAAEPALPDRRGGPQLAAAVDGDPRRRERQDGRPRGRPPSRGDGPPRSARREGRRGGISIGAGAAGPARGPRGAGRHRLDRRRGQVDAVEPRRRRRVLLRPSVEDHLIVRELRVPRTALALWSAPRSGWPAR